MELTFLGTSAGVPTRTRNMTSIILNLQQPTRAEMWLFDCGEGTQHQFLHTPHHPGKLNKIFITHLHGDHLFGLPGLLCSRSMQGNSLPLTVYGPKGIKEFIDTALRLSGSWTDYPLTIIEVGPGLVFDEEGYRVSAFPLSHPVECYGYRIEQHDKPGALDAAQLIADGVPPDRCFTGLSAVNRSRWRMAGRSTAAATWGPLRRVKRWPSSAIPPPARRRWKWRAGRM